MLVKLFRRKSVIVATMVACFLGAFLLTILGNAADRPLLRGEIDRSHAERHYRNMVTTLRDGAWSFQCSLLSSGFEGRFQSSDPLSVTPGTFGRGQECRNFRWTFIQPTHPDEVKLIALRKGPQRRMMTVEYIARWNYEQATVETMYIDQLVRNPFGDVRLYRRWTFEDKRQP